MLGVLRLHDECAIRPHPFRQSPEHGEGPLARAEIGKSKELIRGDEARRAKRRGTEQLEHAARPHHDLRVRGGPALRLHLRAARVRVVARDARLRKAPAHGVLHALRAPPERREPPPAAARTQFG